MRLQQNYRWANRIKLSKSEAYILAAVYTAAVSYLPTFEVFDSVPPLRLRQWMILFTGILSIHTTVSRFNHPELGPLFLLWFGIINHPFPTLLSLPIAALCYCCGEHACAAILLIGVLGYLYGCHAKATGSDRMDEERFIATVDKIKVIYEKAFEELVDEAKVQLIEAYDEFAAQKVTHVETQNTLLADILSAKGKHEQTLTLLLEEQKARTSDQTKPDTATQKYREQLDAANEKVLSAMTELKAVYKKKSEDSTPVYWTPQAHSHSMYALTDSEIEKDKYGNWTGPPGPGEGSPIKAKGNVRAVRSKRQMNENWRAAKEKEKDKDKDNDKDVVV